MDVVGFGRVEVMRPIGVAAGMAAEAQRSAISGILRDDSAKNCR
jgi:hypothetical protein